MISIKNTLKAITSKFSALNTLLNDVPHYTLLWTNSGTTYSGGQITCDLSGYDAILLQVYYSSNQYTASHIYPYNPRVQGSAGENQQSERYITNFGEVLSFRLLPKEVFA